MAIGIGNAWHIPDHAEPAGRASMRLPLRAIEPAGNISVVTGNQFQGPGVTGNQTQTGSALFTRKPGDRNVDLPADDFPAAPPATTSISSPRFRPIRSTRAISSSIIFESATPTGRRRSFTATTRNPCQPTTKPPPNPIRSPSRSDLSLHRADRPFHSIRGRFKLRSSRRPDTLSWPVRTWRGPPLQTSSRWRADGNRRRPDLPHWRGRLLVDACERPGGHSGIRIRHDSSPAHVPDGRNLALRGPGLERHRSVADDIHGRFEQGRARLRPWREVRCLRPDRQVCADADVRQPRQQGRSFIQGRTLVCQYSRLWSASRFNG